MYRVKREEKSRITNISSLFRSLDDLNINEIIEFLNCILLNTAIVIFLMNSIYGHYLFI